MKTLFVSCCLILFPLISYADLRLPHIISEGMVVQRFEHIPVWGWAEPNESLVVDFAGESQTVKSNKAGRWSVQFSPRSEGGPFSLTIKSTNSHIQLNDILIGDVWVCSGQSNMEWMLRDANNAELEISKATDSNIRHFKVPKSWSIKAEDTLAGGGWQVSSPELAKNFTAVGYFFAKNVRKHADVPIGLINSSWGGSNIESWMAASLLGMTDLQAETSLQKSVALERVTKVKAEKKVNQWSGALIDEAIQNVGALAKANWSAFDLKEDDWINIQAPLLWENSGFQGLDGVAWYRKSIMLSEEESKHDSVLHLARIDDVDTTWVNGVKVGATGVYSHERHYPVAKELLKVGRNVIAIRVDDTGGGGGIYSDSELSWEQSEKTKSLSGDWKFKVEKGYVTLAENKNHTATALYNKMMNPLFQVPVKGVLWYQGESNANTPEQAFEYRNQFKSLIQHWRTQWETPKMPFFWVQLANFKSGRDVAGYSPWAILRESQSQALELPYTGQAITIDVGNAVDIHPRDKQTVGKRLANLALHQVYGFSEIKSRGPTFSEYKRKNNTIIVQMLSASSLRPASKAHKSIKGFTIAGKDKLFYPAQAIIDGTRLIVSSEELKHPVAVRYAWSDNPELANLSDENGRPAEPFRTDQW